MNNRNDAMEEDWEQESQRQLEEENDWSRNGRLKKAKVDIACIQRILTGKTVGYEFDEVGISYHRNMLIIMETLVWADEQQTNPDGKTVYCELGSFIDGLIGDWSSNDQWRSSLRQERRDFVESIADDKLFSESRSKGMRIFGAAMAKVMKGRGSTGYIGREIEEVCVLLNVLLEQEMLETSLKIVTKPGKGPIKW